MSTGYSITSYWGPRRETPEQLAARFLKMIDLLKDIHPAFDNWICGIEDKPKKLEKIRNNFTAEVAACVDRAEDGRPTPIGGYHLGGINSFKNNARNVAISIHAGRWTIGDYYINCATFVTGFGISPDPAIITYPVWKAVVLALAESWEVTWAAAYPDDLAKLWSPTVKFQTAWITYISPRFARLITPPRTAFVEYRPNGGLVMAATDETFITANPAHLAAARDIEAAIAPFNALPWPPDAEPG
jgi:hypothetical protein